MFGFCRQNVYYDTKECEMWVWTCGVDGVFVKYGGGEGGGSSMDTTR
jgi:hypothetical protein